MNMSKSKLALMVLLLPALACGCKRFSKWRDDRKARKAQEMAIFQAGVAQRRTYLEEHLSPAVRKSVPEKFYSYSGFRDWWRLPLVFPYQLFCVDTLDEAMLEIIGPDYDVENPNKSSESTRYRHIQRLRTDNRLLILHVQHERVGTYFLLDYASGTSSSFGSEGKCWLAAQAAGYTGPTELLSIREMFDVYYDWANDFGQR